MKGWWIYYIIYVPCIIAGFAFIKLVDAPANIFGLLFIICGIPLSLMVKIIFD